QFPAGRIVSVQMRSPVAGKRVDRRLEVMKALRAHVHPAVDLEHARVAFGDFFRGPEVPGRQRGVHESAEKAPLARGRVVTKDGEILARVGTPAGETDVDPFLAVHAQRVPTLLQGQARGGNVVKGNRSFGNRPGVANRLAAR